jgi:hypothetical protein
MPIGLVIAGVFIGLLAYLIFDGQKGLKPDLAQAMRWLAIFVCMMLVGGLLLYVAVK